MTRNERDELHRTAAARRLELERIERIERIERLQWLS